MVEAELVRRAQHASGEQAIAAYRDVVQNYQDIAYRAAYLASGSLGAAENIAEDAFVKVFTDLRSLDQPQNIESWLLKYVTDEALLFRNSTDQQPNLDLESTSASRSERSMIVLRALNQVSDMDRIVLTYRYTLDLSDDEIAMAVRLEPDDVAGRIDEAERHLHDKIAQMSTNDGQDASDITMIGLPGEVPITDPSTVDTVEIETVTGEPSEEPNEDGSEGDTEGDGS